jgi:tetratricopeptide (TPR) repeat protein
MKNTKDAIQIYKDIKINDEGIDRLYLFLSKLCMEAGLFEEAYTNFLKCYKHRQYFENWHPAKVEIELNLMMFFKVLKDVTEKYKEVLNIEDKKTLEERRREAISVYDKMRHKILERE